MSKIKKGDVVVVLPHDHIAAPVEATVIALTTDPTKQIAVEFEEAHGRHSCDGRGKDGRCYWVHPSLVRTIDTHRAVLADAAARGPAAEVTADMHVGPATSEN